MIENHLWNMNICLEQANKAFSQNEVPVGCVICDPFGKEISKSHNLKEQNNDPCGHAEIIAIKKAANRLNSWRLINCIIYISLEPCIMCLGAILNSRISTIVFGAYDLKGGAISLGLNIHKDKRLNHQLSVIGGISEYNCSKIMTNFFRERRKFY